MNPFSTPIPDRLFNLYGYPAPRHKRFSLSLRNTLKEDRSFGPGDKFILGSSTGKTHWFTATTSMHCNEVEKHRGEDTLWIEGEIMGDPNPAQFQFIHLRKHASLEIALAIFAYNYPLFKRTADLGVAAGPIAFGQMALGGYRFNKCLPTIRHLLVIALLEPEALPDIHCGWERMQAQRIKRLLRIWMQDDPNVQSR